MDRRPVESSHIVAVGYDPAVHKMHVEFSNGTIYEYRGVQEHTHKALMESNSTGEHFARHIKVKFNGRRIN